MAFMPLPKKIRRLAPQPVRDNLLIRAVAVGLGIIPPRSMHTKAEAELIGKIASQREVVVEIGAYEGSSASRIAPLMQPTAELHLIDPFVNTALREGQRGSAWATKRVVKRAARKGKGCSVTLHQATSEEVANNWQQQVDFVFIDGDHSEEACLLDWRLWNGFVRPSGVVAFHDARDGKPSGWGLPGPTTVVDSLFRDGTASGDWSILEEVDTVVAVARNIESIVNVLSSVYKDRYEKSRMYAGFTTIDASAGDFPCSDR